MKLSDIRPSLETSGDLEEQFFSIQDQGMIFDILRNKMYSNPILAICREISCNARDAHREVGKRDVPVQIYLPNNLEPYFKIKDFGPGISPDRMTNIFIKYTASTKRDDNTQTGGFGLGAKTPFSYSDSFSIMTNFDGIAYNYSCVIDETKVGKLLLLSKTATKEPNGTEIIIPVKSIDFYNFNQFIESATRHWDVKPIFKGGTVTYQNQKKVLEGTNWAFVSHESYQSLVKLIIDGIEYPLELSALRTYADATILDSTRNIIMLDFGVGELSLSANREAVYLDLSTKNKIKQRLLEVTLAIKAKIDAKIATFTSLWEANVFYRKELSQVFFNQTFLGQLSWNGYKLSDKYLAVICPAYIFSKGKYSRKSHINDPNKIVRSVAQSLFFEENSVLYVNDLPLKNPTPKHLKKAFENNPTAKSIQVICPTDKVTVADLNKSINLDQMKPQLLSSITKASGRAYTPATNRLIVFKYYSDGNHFKQVSYSSIDEDPNEKVLCITSKDIPYITRKIELKNKTSLHTNAIKSLAIKYPTFSFYAVDESTEQSRIEEEFADFKAIDDFIEEKLTNNKTIDYVRMRFALNLQYSLDDRAIKDEWKIVHRLLDTNSFYIKRREVLTKIKKVLEEDAGLLELYESINKKIDAAQLKKWVQDHPEFDIEDINNKYEKQYPLLKHLNTYGFQHNISTDPIAHYINLIDKEKKDEKNV